MSREDRQYTIDDVMERFTVWDPRDESRALARLRVREARDKRSHSDQICAAFRYLRAHRYEGTFKRRDRRNWRTPYALKHLAERWADMYVSTEAARVAGVAAGMWPPSREERALGGRQDFFLVPGARAEAEWS